MESMVLWWSVCGLKKEVCEFLSHVYYDSEFKRVGNVPVSKTPTTGIFPYVLFI